MPDIIRQEVPGGCYAPQEQVDFCLGVVRNAAEHLKYSGRDELEIALEDMQKPLVELAAAGVLAAITFSLHDLQGVCGATAILDPDAVADFEVVDLSRLRLLANSEARGSIEIVCLDMALAHSIVGEGWLPQSSPSLSVSQIPATVSNNEDEKYKEDSDEYDNDQA